LTLLGAAIVTFAVVGWFLGWYKVHTSPGSDGHRHVDIEFNGKKIQEDIKRGEQRVLDTVQHRSSSGTTGQQTPGGVVTLPAPTPIAPLPAPGSLPQPPSLPPLPSGQFNGPVIVRPAPSPAPTVQPAGGTWISPPPQ
jgi:hypothetical protein